ncbi:F-box/LRR-repeat protein At4g14103-like isoform X1 [Malania oleifera]|uniref:F-box/LRR-repeat protein At4g14103-like isoform X1 n=1 Tax=Malania oleifera TaxID=397392 RepID=UPI0025ADF1BC|nr:F-box/LRR-repeat protein At4g14103-like isoform X1 [Malania oleifera]
MLKSLKILDGADESVDSISSLPDSLLCHILSFLPTKDAVRTSTLSARWKYLFASIPDLDFDESLVGHPCFVDFVYRSLALRGSLRINAFRLKCYVSNNYPHLNAWISAAVCRDVREFDLLIDANRYLLCSNLFTCQTLVVLKLDLNFCFNVPANVRLPSLKILHLVSVEFENDCSMETLFSGCPVLEDLHMRDCWLDSLPALDISISTLKNLTIKSESAIRYKVTINAPSLECLDYFDVLADGYTLENLNSLSEAHIDVKPSIRYVNSFFHFSACTRPC